MEEFQEIEIIFNSTQDALFLIGENQGHFVYLRNNLKHQEMTGFHIDDLKGKTPTEVLGEQMGTRHEDYCRQCLKDERTITFEETTAFKGEKRVMMTKFTPIIMCDGKRYIVCSRIDVTKFSNLIEEKEEQLSKFMPMFEKHLAIMLLIEPETGKIFDANPAAVAFYGYQLEELLNMTIQDINMLTRQEVEENRNRALDREQKYFVFPHKRKSGEVRIVDVYSCPVTFGDKTLLYSIIFDVTERERNREELFKEKELLHITFDSIGDGVITTDIYGGITRINRAAKNILACKEENIIGKNFQDVFFLKSAETGEDRSGIIRRVLDTGQPQLLEENTVLTNMHGIEIPIADSASPILNEKGEIQGSVMAFRDITAENERKERILYLSYHDALTGLYNRRYFDEQIGQINISQNRPVAIIMGDMNGLKITNDVFGHEIGDQLLKTISELIKENLRPEDIAVRWGGDEFVIMMPNTDEKAAEFFLNILKGKMKYRKINGVVKTSASFGYSIVKNEDDTIEIALQKAEESMYRLKLLDSKSIRSSIINTMLSTLSERSSETKEHANRLEQYCMQIGMEMELRSEELGELSLLSVLHDIGKIGVDQYVLQKPGPLTPEEWIEMKRHPEIGYRITLNVPELSNVSEYILYHHERWDGHGYPRGLKQDEIPVNCRILAVADAYDAMISDRVYRKAMSKEDAVTELKKNAGSQFDPHIVEIFIRILLQKNIAAE